METNDLLMEDEDISFFLFLLTYPKWFWRRICPVNGKVILTKRGVAELGHGWAVKSALIESKKGERVWINCEVTPPENMKSGMNIRRRFFGRLHCNEYSKQIFIERFSHLF